MGRMWGPQIEVLGTDSVKGRSRVGAGIRYPQKMFPGSDKYEQ